MTASYVESTPVLARGNVGYHAHLIFRSHKQQTNNNNEQLRQFENYFTIQYYNIFNNYI